MLQQQMQGKTQLGIMGVGAIGLENVSPCDREGHDYCLELHVDETHQKDRMIRTVSQVACRRRGKVIDFNGETKR